MAIPSFTLRWASVSRYDPSTGFANKLQPLKQFQDSGLVLSNNPSIPNQMLGDAYYNYQIDLISQWIDFIHSRNEVGNILIWETTGQAATLGTLFSGTWAERGTSTIAGGTKYIYERIA